MSARIGITAAVGYSGVRTAAARRSYVVMGSRRDLLMHLSFTGLWDFSSLLPGLYAGRHCCGWKVELVVEQTRKRNKIIQLRHGVNVNVPQVEFHRTASFHRSFFDHISSHKGNCSSSSSSCSNHPPLESSFANNKDSLISPRSRGVCPRYHNIINLSVHLLNGMGWGQSWSITFDQSACLPILIHRWPQQMIARSDGYGFWLPFICHVHTSCMQSSSNSFIFCPA